MAMAQTSVQYTPVQVLQAARRAEAEGKMDYALQFYRHIVEHHGTTVEAQEAREGLFRIAEWRWGEARLARRQDGPTNGSPAPNGASAAHAEQPAPQQSAPQPQQPQPQARPIQQQPEHQPQQRERDRGPQNNHQASHQQNHQGGHQGQGSSGPRPVGGSGQPGPQQAYDPDHSTPLTGGVTQLPQIIAREAAAKAAEAAGVHEPYVQRYRAGRTVAMLLSTCGWLSVLGGVILVAMGFGDFGDISATGILGLPLGFALGTPIAFLGLALVVGGYVAVAVFESANATLEILSQRGRRGAY